MKQFSTRATFLAFAIFLSVNVFAQASKENAITMKQGKMMIITDGTATEMKKDHVTSNGTMFKVDGTVVSNTGTSIKMKNGDKLDMNGKKLTQQPAQQAATPAGNH
jgi:Pyruvate/2-oxoacid:ferredoxin oxidoreductase gamma subunit